jgi:magnesium chelatase family protein
MDRIDLWVYVSPVAYEKLNEQVGQNESPGLRDTVARIRQIQKIRFKDEPRVTTNSDMSSKEILSYAKLSKEAELMLMQSAEKLKLSARAYHRIIKLARTIADLEESSEIMIPHILEALQYRPKV